jgi:hypothetical protein
MKAIDVYRGDSSHHRNGLFVGRLKMRAAYRLGRIRWWIGDVHRGNGAQPGFLRRSEHVGDLVASGGCVRRGRASRNERGESCGEGFNINAPLWPGCSAGAYRVAFERIVVPALTRGLFGLRRSAVRSARVDDDAQRRLSRYGAMPIDATTGLRGGLAMSHDAGYSVSRVQHYGLAVMEQLSGIKTPISAPFLANVSGDSGQAL